MVRTSRATGPSHYSLARLSRGGISRDLTGDLTTGSHWGISRQSRARGSLRRRSSGRSDGMTRVVVRRTAHGPTSGGVRGANESRSLADVANTSRVPERAGAAEASARSIVQLRLPPPLAPGATTAPRSCLYGRARRARRLPRLGTGPIGTGPVSVYDADGYGEEISAAFLQSSSVLQSPPVGGFWSSPNRPASPPVLQLQGGS